MWDGGGFTLGGYSAENEKGMLKKLGPGLWRAVYNHGIRFWEFPTKMGNGSLESVGENSCS